MRVKKGSENKKVGRSKGRHWKVSKKSPSLGGEQFLFKNKKKNTKNKTNPPKKKTEKNKQKTKKTQKYQKLSFQLSVKIFFVLGGVSKISLFWHLCPKSAHPQNTIKVGVSANQLWKTDKINVTKRQFWGQNPNPEIQITFFLPFSFPLNSKNTTIAETPIL